MRVVCIVASFAPRVSVFGENSFYRAPGDKLAGYSQQQYATGEPGKVQGRDRVGIVKRSCWYRARVVSVQGKFVLSRNSGYNTKVAMSLKIVLTPGGLPRSHSSGTGPSSSCGYCCPLCPMVYLIKFLYKSCSCTLKLI